MFRPKFALLASVALLSACVLGEATTTTTIDPSLLAQAQSRSNDGVLREEDVRGGVANGTVGDQMGTVTATSVARVGSGSIQDYLVNGTPLPATMPNASRNELNQIYSARGYRPIWFQNGSWTGQAQQVLGAFVNATVDGLLPRDYLPGERSLPRGLREGSPQVAQIDLELTAGLLRYLRDAKEGRYSGRSGLNVTPMAQAVLASGNIEEGIAAQVPQGQMYQAIRQRGKTQVQFLNGAQFDAYRVTMEYLRANPVSINDNGRYIVSNIAAQEVLAMRNGQTELGMNMVVGRPTRQTPISDDGITSVKFSPDWTAPRSIVRKDLVPRAPEIFEQMGIEVRSNGQAIDPSTITWTEDVVSQYDFVQPPGPRNVLGGVRFTLQNSAAIYMHDSPDRVLFQKASRTYSSGCMRLEKSAELALWLLRDQDPSWTLDRVREAMSQSEVEFVRLNQRVPVKTVYLEAWPSHTGGLRVVPDIYGQNTELRQRMGISVRTSTDPADLSAFQTSVF